MKIALFGYGKMGQLIENLATQRGHTVSLVVHQANRTGITIEDLADIDVAIDFSQPAAVLENVRLCFAANTPIVVGTTGWHDALLEIQEECLASNNALIYGSNFSIGVNVLFYINKKLAEVMRPYQSYDVQLEEIHHTQKLDAPSGTAITLANGILAQHMTKKQWINNLVGEGEEHVPQPNELLIESHRIEDVPGTHTVIYSSEIDQIELKHVAHSRKGFALGAVVAAEWILGKQGFYEISEMFDFK
jgi:4-hydroxy-tetrahydrodipicolinate reductase